MATAVVMPQLGNSVESSIILEWKKQVGDTISEGEALVEVETDKATIDVESPVSGTVLAHFFGAGDDVAVKVPIAAIGAPGEDYESLRPVESSTGSAPVTETSAPVSPVPPSGNGHAAPTPSSTTEPTTDGRQAVSPRARNLAARKAVDLSNIAGTGPGGRIIERDVEAALAQQPRLTPVAQSMIETGEYVAPQRGTGPGGRITKRDLQPAATQQPTEPPPSIQPSNEEAVERIPIKGMRKVIASRMLESMQTTAQLTLNATADARGLLAYRQQLKASNEALGLQKISINDLLMFVVARTLLDFPEMNAHYTGDTIERYKAVHLGFAVDTPRGLIVPVIRNAHALSLKALSAEAKRLANACLEGTVLPDELNGGTFTVTNLGSLGIDDFTPILNPPQVGILGVGGINLKPVEVNGTVEFIQHIGLSLTINHQAVDGAPGARFLQAVTQNLAQFDLILAL